MNNLLTAIALTIALPAMAHAQAAPAPEAKKDCCEKMKDSKECCCKAMDHKDHGKDHGSKGEHGAHQR